MRFLKSSTISFVLRMTSLPNRVAHKAMIMKCQILLTAVHYDMQYSKSAVVILNLVKIILYLLTKEFVSTFLHDFCVIYPISLQ